MWDKEILNRLAEKRSTALAGGGEVRVRKQHASGKKTARERLSLLFDDSGYQELDQFVEPIHDGFHEKSGNMLGDGVVIAYGKIEGCYAVASSQDFTLNGGTLGKRHAAKICNAMDMALRLGVPYIAINDSGGARIEEGIDSLSGYGEIFSRNVAASGKIPQISVIMGPCAGGACYSPALCDFIFMVDNIGKMFLTGPEVVKSVTHETVDAETLGGSKVHMSKSGVAHFAYKDEEKCLCGVRQLLSYLPSNHQAPLPVKQGTPRDLCKALDEVISDNQRKCYDVRAVVFAFADKDSFLEVQPEFAQNAIVGFCRIDGECTGIVANQPNFKSGALDYDASDKIARFVRLCDCFRIPLLTLVDVPAFLPGVEQEYHGVIRHGAKMLYAYAEATVPKITVVLRKAYGGAYIAMCSKSLGADIVYAFPIAEIAVLGASGAISIIGRKQLDAAADPELERKKLEEEYSRTFLNPYEATARGLVNEVILPAELRGKIVEGFKLLHTKQPRGSSASHGNIPL